jgi:7-cyano-7-deazaguanine reductase
LKEYLGAYRDLPIFHEHLVNKIWNELFETIEPKALSVEVQVAIRGGIATTVMRSKGFKFVGV